MNALLDTDVIIDVLRGNPNAQSWLASTSATIFAIPGVTPMELIMGCRNQGELYRLQHFLNTFSGV